MVSALAEGATHNETMNTARTTKMIRLFARLVIGPSQTIGLKRESGHCSNGVEFCQSKIVYLLVSIERKREKGSFPLGIRIACRVLPGVILRGARRSKGRLKWSNAILLQRRLESMSGEYEAMQNAKKLEEIRFNQWLSESARKRDDEISKSRQSLAARGISQSPMNFTAEVRIILNSIEEGIDKAVGLRRELGAKIPALFNPSELQPLQSRLERFIDHSIEGIKQRQQFSGRGGDIATTQEAQDWAFRMKHKLKQALSALALEATLGMHEVKLPAMTISISNNTIANLNLGNVVGDITGSIQQLNASGRNDLADAFKRITEAIGASPEISDEVRKELLEHLSLVSGEAAKPAEARKLGLLRSSVAAITSGLSIATQALTVWQQAEPLLKAAGIIR
jgi:hypothetical protein